MGWIWFCSVMISVFSGFAVFKAVRARIIAGRAGILKVCVNGYVLILQLVFCGLFIFYGFGRLNESEKYFRAARSYEMLLDGWDKVHGSEYQQAAMKTETVSAENIGKIRNNIEACRKNGRALKAYAIFLFALSFSELVLTPTACWYITQSGVVLGNFKTPEPIYAVLNGDKIDINYTAQLVNVRKLQSFKATPKNLEVFGRFMIQSYPQYPQNVQLPPNMQFPRYPQAPQNPQMPQSMPYAQYPQQYQQPPQNQQPPQDPTDP